MATCKSCGAPVQWAVTALGARMPIDPEPVADGNLVMLAPIEAEHRVRSANAGEKRVGVGLYRSHFSTCPNADKHRRDTTPPSAKAARAKALADVPTLTLFPGAKP